MLQSTNKSMGRLWTGAALAAASSLLKSAGSCLMAGSALLSCAAAGTCDSAAGVSTAMGAAAVVETPSAAPWGRRSSASTRGLAAEEPPASRSSLCGSRL